MSKIDILLRKRFNAARALLNAAIEKGQLTGNCEAAEREAGFYMARAAYRFTEKMFGKERAKKELLEDPSKGLDAEYIAHIINGTVPEF